MREFNKRRAASRAKSGEQIAANKVMKNATKQAVAKPSNAKPEEVLTGRKRRGKRNGPKGFK